MDRLWTDDASRVTGWQGDALFYKLTHACVCISEKGRHPVTLSPSSFQISICIYFLYASLSHNPSSGSSVISTLASELFEQKGVDYHRE